MNDIQNVLEFMKSRGIIENISSADLIRVN